MRVGELAALHWTDIRDGRIYIDYSEHRLDYDDHSVIVIDEPKSLKHRSFPLNTAIEDVLERIRALGYSSEFVFGNDEEYYNYDNSDFSEKKAAAEHLCSNVLTFLKDI